MAYVEGEILLPPRPGHRHSRVVCILKSPATGFPPSSCVHRTPRFPTLSSQCKPPQITDLFSRVLFPFCPFCWRPLFLSFSWHLSALFSSSKSALFCRGRGTAQSSERGSFRMNLSPKFGKEIHSGNLREKRSDNDPKFKNAQTVCLRSFCMCSICLHESEEGTVCTLAFLLGLVFFGGLASEPRFVRHPKFVPISSFSSDAL